MAPLLGQNGDTLTREIGHGLAFKDLLAMLGLSPQHSGAFSGIEFLNQVRTQGPCFGVESLSHWTMGSPLGWLF